MEPEEINTPEFGKKKSSLEISDLHSAATSAAFTPQPNQEPVQEDLSLFTCLIDMVALEEGLFSARNPFRLQVAQNNLRNGLRVADGSLFKYSSVDGPTVTYGATEDEKN